MPLTPQYTWEEDASSLAIHIPLKGVSRKDVDIFVADLVVKVNFKPYVLVVDLNDLVEHEKTVKEPKMWTRLCFTGEKHEILTRRKESMQRREVFEQKMAEQRKDTKYKNEKKTLRDQMALEEQERQRLDDLKAEEKQREEESMYRTFQEIQEAKAAAKSNTVYAKSNLSATKPIAQPIKAEPTVIELKNGVFDIPEDDIESDTESEDNNAAHEELSPRPETLPEESPEEEQVIYLPPPREQASSKIVFTPRVFPTPSRESKAAEEEDWLVKNRKHLKTHKGLHATAAAQDISETDPAWLKAKGDEFYNHRDFRSAINAYGEALAVDPTLTACLSNRAACFLHVGEYQLCADDCTKALAQIPDRGDEPVSVQRLKLKVKVLVRRGTAYCQLGLYSQAKADYGVALTLHPQNEDLQHDFARIGLLEMCAEWKQKGDSAYSSQDYATAREMYSEALKLDGTFISCLSNRAACHLALFDAFACVQDCSQALTILQDSVPSSVPYSAIPVAGSEKRRLWVLKTLVRRGAAYMMAKDWAKAEKDYADGLSLDPDNSQLQDDLAHVRRLKIAS
ncbi:hypothetical protein AeNC1_007531 [Aphanomyces euteiches]|nr:hypothetical protein AeNC1_007531 [Aphanomyces euteiches]